MHKDHADFLLAMLQLPTLHTVMRNLHVTLSAAIRHTHPFSLYIQLELQQILALAVANLESHHFFGNSVKSDSNQLLANDNDITTMIRVMSFVSK